MGLLIVQLVVLIDMDIRSYFGSSSKLSTLVHSCSSNSDSSSKEAILTSPTNKPC